jgi:anti-sigma-K factor RskA
MKTDRSHDEIEELIAADALDGLEQAERDRLLREMASHGPECPDCARLLSEYSEVAGWLAMALEPTPLSKGAEERLIRAAPEDALSDRPAPPAIGRWRRWAAAASVAAVLAAIGGAVGWAIAPRGPNGQPQFIAFVARPGARVATLAATGGRSLAVAFRPGEREAWVVGAGLPDPAGGKVYELWYRTGGSGPMRPAGTFSPRDGTVVAGVDVGTSFDTLAVSVEPAGGSEQPTTEPIYLVSV